MHAVIAFSNSPEGQASTDNRLGSKTKLSPSKIVIWNQNKRTPKKSSLQARVNTHTHTAKERERERLE